MKTHFERLKWIYRTNPCNRYYEADIDIQEGLCELHLAVRPDYLHGGGMVHGSTYFKLLDDAGTFAASSLVTDAGILTASYNIYFTRPIAEGVIRAVGQVVHRSRRLFLAESVAYDGDGRVLARGSGSFMKANFPLPTLSEIRGEV